jgi:uncharacterized protein
MSETVKITATTFVDEEEEEERRALVQQLFDSCRYGDYDQVKEIITNCLNRRNSDQSSTTQRIIDAEDEEGRTALFFAAANGHVEIAEFLLEQECDGNKRNKKGSTALHWACLNGNWKICEILMKKGKANAFVVNDSGRTAMDEAMHNDRQECVKVIMELTKDDDDDCEDDVIDEEDDEDDGNETIEKNDIDHHHHHNNNNNNEDAMME